jgi:asparagine synthase (glutamine-hydrolysing)
MCGIAGIVMRAGEAANRELIERMADRLGHRGPDDSGVFIHENVGLGHTRLAVIDTSEAGRQPLFNEDGSVAVVFNGEIYNYRELVEELTKAGHVFRSRTDTEVIAHAWEEYREACLERFRGMFALAILDTRLNRLFLARDRLGKKPLYYAATEGLFAFGSEIKALRVIPGLSDEIDLAAMLEYATYGNTLGERSIWRSVRRLEPGCHLSVDTLAGTVVGARTTRYWAPTYQPDYGPSESEWLEELDGALSESVRLRLVSDVPLGAFLSGGIDSGLVVSYMAEHSAEPVRTFTMRFSDPGHDESAHAEAVARHFGTQHHSELVTELSAMEVLDALVDMFDEPFGDESAIPTFQLSQMARRFVTVALSGDGGDESFAGYDRYRHVRRLGRIGHAITPAGRWMAGAVASRLPLGARARRPLERLSLNGFAQYQHALGFSDTHLGLLTRDVREGADSAQAARVEAGDPALSEAPWPDRFAFHDLQHYLPDDVLVKVDRASMANSLEVRCPLLDHEVVELAGRIPLRFKLSTLRGKVLLRRLAASKLPASSVGLPKRGFGVPVGEWLRGDGPLVGYLEAALRDTQNTAWDYFHPGAVGALLRAHTSGKTDLHTGLWRALFFYHWCQRQSLARV